MLSTATTAEEFRDEIVKYFDRTILAQANELAYKTMNEQEREIRMKIMASDAVHREILKRFTF